MFGKSGIQGAVVALDRNGNMTQGSMTISVSLVATDRTMQAMLIARTGGKAQTWTTLPVCPKMVHCTVKKRCTNGNEKWGFSVGWDHEILGYTGFQQIHLGMVQLYGWSFIQQPTHTESAGKRYLHTVFSMYVNSNCHCVATSKGPKQLWYCLHHCTCISNLSP